jgi:hypothetical protein
VIWIGTIDYYLNDGTPEIPDFIYQSALTDFSGNEIDVGITSSPFLYDVNNDGDLDLSIGGFDGKIKYYENTGTQIQFNFVLIDDFFDGIDVGDNSSPQLIDYNGNGTTDLFTGNRTGNFYYYLNNGTNEIPEWSEQSDMFLTDNFGNITVPRFIDIDSDTDMDLFLGNVKGGLYLYENTTVTTVAYGESELPTGFHLTAHPNPFNPGVSINLYLETKRTVSVSVYNILGEKVKSLFKGELNSGDQSLYWDAKNDSGNLLPSGNYIVAVHSSLGIHSIKITFLK